MSTENIAHEKRYRDWRAQYDAMFAPENRSPQQDEQFPLTDGYSICSKAYCHNGDFYLNGSENELLDIEGKMRYAWRNLDADGEFCSLFRHRNGKHYLIFRTELYEYSVLEVESGQEMHYVPACVHPEEGQKPEEVFIWISADYDPGANLLAVTGCIWACPYSTIVLDFPAHSSLSPRSIGWICGASLTRTIPGSMTLSLSAGRTARWFSGAAMWRTAGGKRFGYQQSSCGLRCLRSKRKAGGIYP